MDASAAVNSTVKTPEAESETPTRIQPLKRGGSPFATANGVLKRHALPQQHLHPPVVVAYKECLKNHAAVLGGHAVDGCGEFMPSPGSDPADPTSLKCAACGCHRNFHRREPDEVQPAAMAYTSHHRHHPLPPRGGGDSGGSSPNDSPSPPPISSSYYPTAPQMLLALSHGATNPVHPDANYLPSAAVNATATPRSNSNTSRKRFRTKFTQNQKQQMLELAEKVDWKMQKKDDNLITQSCTQIGVERAVFKVWMHNNKNSFTKRDNPTNPPSASATVTAAAVNGVNYTASPTGESHNHHQPNNESSHNHGTNGSSSSS